MERDFFKLHASPLTVMLQCATPELAIKRIRNAGCLGAEAFSLQTESLEREYQNPEVYQWIFKEMRGRPVYVTHYRGAKNKGKSDEELAEGLITLAECGATLVDVMGDLFAKHPEELTDDETAIQKQMKLIDTLHEKGAKVLMSSHVLRFIPAERVLEIALEQKRRGADIIKIVTGANTMEEQLENMRIITLLKEQLGAPFLLLCNGQCTLLRRLGWKLGNCMTLCVYEHDAFSTISQPLLSTMKTVRDNLDF